MMYTVLDWRGRPSEDRRVDGCGQRTTEVQRVFGHQLFNVDSGHR